MAFSMKARQDCGLSVYRDYRDVALRMVQLHFL